MESRRRLTARAREQQTLRCPLCFEGLEQLAFETCPTCQVRAHTACRDEFGGCPHGCERGVRGGVAAQERLSAWQAQARERLERIEATRWAQNRGKGRKRARAAKDPWDAEVVVGVVALVLLAIVVVSQVVR